MRTTSSITQQVRSVLGSLLVAGFVAAPVAQAAVNIGDVQVGGFISQGYLKSTENNYPIDTKGGTADFREMGFNASTNLGTRLRLSAQLFAQKLGKYGDDKVNLDWASLDYALRPEVGFRVGRLKYPRGLNSDMLDLDVVRPFIILPQSNYDIRLRDYQKSFDGGMVYGSLSAGSNTFDYKVFGGELPLRTDSGVADFWNATSIFATSGITSLEADKVYGGALTWGTPIAGLRFGVNYSRLPSLEGKGPFRQIPTFPASIRLDDLSYRNGSVEYTRGPWTFLSEYLVARSSSQVTLPAVAGGARPAGKYGTKSYYLSVARRLGDRFEVGTYYSHMKLSYPSTPGPQTARRDAAVAVRFDYNEHLLFKLEAHSIKGTQDIANVPGIENPPGSLKDSMLLFAAKTTLSF